MQTMSSFHNFSKASASVSNGSDPALTVRLWDGNETSVLNFFFGNSEELKRFAALIQTVAATTELRADAGCNLETGADLLASV